MKRLYSLLESHEEWLMSRILEYARERDYAQYTSTLKEAWRLSIQGLSEPMMAALAENRTDLELSPDEDFGLDPVASFGILEAQRHRDRGINLGMFLGLMKYYRQTYLDLVAEADLDPTEEATSNHFIHRFFDRVELGFSTEWISVKKDQRVSALQDTNRRMTNEKNKYLTLFNSITVPMLLLDITLKVENINVMAADFLHLANQNLFYKIDETGTPDFVGKHIAELLPWFGDELANLANNQSMQFQVDKTIHTPNGDRHYEVIVSSIMDVSGKFAGFIVIINDLTLRKEAELRIQQAKEAAEAANQAKSQFLANMSHELRTPLNAILGFSELLSHNPQNSNADRESLHIINRSGEHLLKLINQVLDLSKIEAGKMTLNLKSFDLLNMLEELVNIFQFQALEKNLQFYFERGDDLPRYVYGDEVKLRQVFINLLNNAIKFTKKGGITLFVHQFAGQVSRRNDDASNNTAHLEFKVRDTGPGIAPEEIDDLFQAFTQTSTGLASHGGTGLGMTISREFVELMGGELKVSSEVEKGTTFTFNVPFQLSSAKDVQPPLPKRRVTGIKNNQVFRILITDDKVDNRNLLVKILQPLGFELAEAANGQEAVHLWRTFQPHFIWMDIRMPVLSGYDATRLIRAEAGSQGLPQPYIVAMTASVFDEEINTVLEAGCDDFLKKPFVQQAALDMLSKYLNIAFIYAEDEDNQSLPRQVLGTPKLPPLENLGLSPTWLKKLRDAVDTVDLEAAGALLNELPPTQAELKHELTALINNFRFDVIQTWLYANHTSITTS